MYIKILFYTIYFGWNRGELRGFLEQSVNRKVKVFWYIRGGREIETLLLFHVLPRMYRKVKVFWDNKGRKTCNRTRVSIPRHNVTKYFSVD